MNLWYLLAAPAWVVILITAAARLHDLGREQWAMRYHIRRVGLMLVGMMAAIMLATPFTADSRFYEPPGWRQFALAWSWSLVWLTTEGLPPWWNYILGVHRQTDEWARMGFIARVRGELRALRKSFTARRHHRDPIGPKGPLP